MNNTKIIENTIAFVKQELANAESGHDWWHMYRVWKTARKIAQTETANGFVVELGALLHDIADAKFYNGNETIGPEKASAFLLTQQVPDHIIAQVVMIIKNISYKNSFDGAVYSSKELDIVQDADRLDAIGAIGIARTFNYGGFKNRPMYDPMVQPNLNQTKEEYKNSTAPTINHFYEKLLLLKDKMNTPTAQKIAEERHVFMQQFLSEFFKEWNVE